MDFWRPIDIIGCYILGRRFIGAQSVDGVLEVGGQLKRQGFKVTYNLLGEHVKGETTVKAALETTFTLINRMDHNNCGNVSCKPTLYGLAISKKLFHESMDAIIQLAYKKGIEIEFDAENYEYIPDTFQVFSGFAFDPCLKNTVRQAVQAHLKKIEWLMDEYKLWDKNLRIVKGSGVYKEDELLISQNEFLVIERYLEILRRNLRSGRVPFVATVRDRRLAEEVIKVTENGRLPIEFQMLHGPLGKTLQRELLSKGYPVRHYVPFTDWWCRDAGKAYGLRRIPMIRKILWEEVKRILFARVDEN
ncbi:MAG: hypothetical protein A3J47_03055 [Candidatus Yanofskybacteria bacterium RIFCSPHIGHO2_02_FULL_43_22]|uniref:Proline dehydrogenase domain-containing protein n=1 Tax=Candidatus Yanofskybacteria bacterium RIFCSPHIGHO2_02_FULL_43_22 TaxID=1802681 RepID=A0A1F8FME0_9BACT|nr:MAG: hypothetical protein A3J47_03055 [Candidatus Yanofskybacteria bacterium RIFCSPHIGHO2_02_FULL_43_22]